MSKIIYCAGKINNRQTVMDVAMKDINYKTHQNKSKRVQVVSIKMVKEGSVLYPNRKIAAPSDTADLVREFLETADREMLLVVCLDTKNQPTCINIASIGTLNSSLLHPREIFKPAILGNAASIIISHNHPSGDTTPSTEDINVTHRVKEASKLLCIDLLDHIIIGFDSYVSLKEKGIILRVIYISRWIYIII